VSDRSFDSFAACLLGGAVGDALGAPIEFGSLREIRARFGPAGLTDYAPAYGRLGAITDDTQMTLFTAEAAIRYDNRLKGKGVASFAMVAGNSYLRWLETQGERPPYPDEHVRNGGLMDLPALQQRRGPGRTCLSALRSGGFGSIARPINNSKGCGGVMRVSPIGLIARPPQAFEEAANAAAVTHGHPSGYLAAGFYAAVVAALVNGSSLRDAIDTATEILGHQRGREETAAAVDAALELAESGRVSSEALETLGAGWVAEEALAIALYCALVTPDYRSGVLLAVNHGGDSDSTGALAGSLLAIIHGRSAIPSEWLERLELRDVITDVAWDLFRHFGGSYVPLGAVQKVPMMVLLGPNGDEQQLYGERDPDDIAKYPGY
jgi:ADP-ribosylglycohydrolase